MQRPKKKKKVMCQPTVQEIKNEKKKWKKATSSRLGKKEKIKERGNVPSTQKKKMDMGIFVY